MVSFNLILPHAVTQNPCHPLTSWRKEEQSVISPWILQDVSLWVKSGWAAHAHTSRGVTLGGVSVPRSLKPLRRVSKAVFCPISTSSEKVCGDLSTTGQCEAMEEEEYAGMQQRAVDMLCGRMLWLPQGVCRFTLKTLSLQRKATMFELFRVQKG